MLNPKIIKSTKVKNFLRRNSVKKWFVTFSICVFVIFSALLVKTIACEDSKKDAKQKTQTKKSDETEKLNNKIEKLIQELSTENATEATKELKKIGKPAAPFLIKALESNSESAILTSSLIVILADVSSNDEAVHTIAKYITNDSKFIAYLAIKVLGYMGNKTATPYLIKSMKTDKITHYRCESMRALWQLKDFSAIQPIIDILEKDENPDMRSGAAYILAEFSRKISEHLVDSMDDKNKQVRIDAIKYTTYSGTALAVEPLRKILKKSQFQKKNSNHHYGLNLTQKQIFPLDR